MDVEGAGHLLVGRLVAGWVGASGSEATMNEYSYSIPNCNEMSKHNDMRSNSLLISTRI